MGAPAAPMDTHLERGGGHAIRGRLAAGPRAPWRVLPLAAMAACAAACALPPPVEERPLDAGVEVTSPRVDSTLSRGEDASPGEVGEVGAGPASPAEARSTQDATTDVIEVQSSESSQLMRVGGAEDTVADAESGPGEGDAPKPSTDADAGAPAPAGADAAAQPATDGSAAEPQQAAVGAAPGGAAPGGATPEPPAAGEPDGANAPVESGGDRVAEDAAVAPAAGDGRATAEEAAAEGRPTPAPDTIERRELPLEAASSPASYLIGGRADAPVVVFLHGWCGSAEQWRAELRRLVPDRRVIALDLPGHGRSRDVERDAWTIPGYATDVAALLRAEEVGAAVLVGHGMGGMVALEVAARMPSRVSAVVGVDSLQALAGEPRPLVQQEYVEAFEADFELQMDDFVHKAVGEGTSVELRERISRSAQEVDEDAAMALMAHFGEYDARDVTRNVQCSVVCINSGVQETDVKGNRALLSSFDLRLLDGVGHWVHLEAPERFHAELVSLLDSLAAAGADPDEPVAAPAPDGGSEPAVRSIGTMIAADDVGALAAFYREVLGFDVAARVPADPARPAESITLTRDGARIIARSAASFRAEFGDDAPLPRATLAVEVARLGPVLERAGDAVVVPPGAEADAPRRAVLADPAGNRIRVSAPAREAGAGDAAEQGG